MARGTTLLACLTQTALSVITGVPGYAYSGSDSISKVRFAMFVSLGSHQSLGRFVDGTIVTLFSSTFVYVVEKQFHYRGNFI